MNIHAEKCWFGDGKECRKLYQQMTTMFGGSVYRIAAHYGWNKRAMLSALRVGRVAP